ncbi:glycosyltransferase family 2 protein [Candidatus Falkowbacteria bacterium]|nr:glycosyltransferase family 2 protein [Candidatus Falkowbacteria bacterium]
MLKNYRIITIIPSYNEQGKTVKVVEKMPLNIVDEVLVINDGSSDNTRQEIEKTGKATIIQNEKQMGIGFAIRRGLEYALKKNYDIIVVMAGNGKDNPSEIPRLVKPIVEQDYDYVQGSRYLKGGEYGKMPLHRTIVTRVYPFLVRLLYAKKITDGTNGFRAYKASILKDKRINLHQEWLRECLEYYLSIKVIQLKYKITEAPVSKLYPQGLKYKQYSKVKPSRFIKRLKPLFFLRFGIKK